MHVSPALQHTVRFLAAHHPFFPSTPPTPPHPSPLLAVPLRPAQDAKDVESIGAFLALLFPSFAEEHADFHYLFYEVFQGAR